MLLKQSVAGQVISFDCAPGVAATQYFVWKNGAAIGFGVGVVVNTVAAGRIVVLVTLTANDCNTLGTVTIAPLDAVPTVLSSLTFNVVTDLPGQRVSEVTGNVDGNVNGNVVGSVGTIFPSTRIQIAQDVINLVDGIEPGLSPRDCLRACFSVLAGKDVVGPLAAGFRNFGDTKTRVTMTFDVNNQRLVVTYDFS